MAEVTRVRADAPMLGLVRGAYGYDARNERVIRGAARARFVTEPRYPYLGKPAPDAADLDRRVARPARYFRAGQAIGHQQHRPGAPTKARRFPRSPMQSLELKSIRLGQAHGARVIGHGRSSRNHTRP